MKKLKFTVITVVFGFLFLTNIAFGEVVISQSIYDGAYAGNGGNSRIIQSLGDGLAGSIQSISYVVSAPTGTPFPSYVDEFPIISWYPTSAYCGTDVDSCVGDTSINRIDRVYPTNTSCAVGIPDTITGLENRTIYFCTATYTDATFNPEYFYTVMFFENSYGTLLGSFADTFTNGHPVAYYGSIGSLGDVYMILNNDGDPIEVCTEDCFSNVLFLPGMMGSRLYEQDGLFDQELWVSTDDSNHEKLSLNNQGKSINDIYTKHDTQKLDGDGDETGIIDDVYSFNIYQSFIADLKKWKEDDKIIADYAFIPYDWRLSLEDIITNGIVSNGNLSYDTPQDFSESFILKKLEALQVNSRTGKVTIIAHSNGGLVAKALIQKLKDTNNPLYGKIDKVILIAVPQIGTPDAMVGILHGTDIGGGFVMGKERSRQLAENMPVMYNLLPSTSYFDTIDTTTEGNSLISFNSALLFAPQIAEYGSTIDSEAELGNYILGTDIREKPEYFDTTHPNIGNSGLYQDSQNAHGILDDWMPSPDTKVIQVAGWGEETIAGLDYKSYSAFPLGTQKMSYKPRMVIDGDSTVVTPSALWMSDSNPNVERWWVDLKSYDTIRNLERGHKDILEVTNLLSFIESKIKDSTSFDDPDNIVVDNTSTLTSSSSRLHFILHSPLTLGIIDTQGRYTGMDPVTKETKEEIPDVDYRQIGEVQFISVPYGVAYTLKMKGYEQGGFSLDVDKQEENDITNFTSFQGIPSSISTIATMDIGPTFEVENSELKIDQNGDGVVDKTLLATPEGITTYDTTPPELQLTFNTTTKDVVFSAQDAVDQNPTIMTTNTSITLKDNAGNVTVIPFTKYKELPTRLKFSYYKIIRNGITTIVPNTNITYDWQENKGVLTDLDTKVTIKGVEKYVFNYKKGNNATIIKEKKGLVIVTITKPGFVVVTVKTEGDSIKVSY
jgi:pimeloyl-ACP methyl ester carboxylesterase